MLLNKPSPQEPGNSDITTGVKGSHMLQQRDMKASSSSSLLQNDYLRAQQCSQVKGTVGEKFLKKEHTTIKRVC